MLVACVSLGTCFDGPPPVKTERLDAEASPALVATPVFLAPALQLPTPDVGESSVPVVPVRRSTSLFGLN